MSGGLFNYQDFTLKNEIFGYDNEKPNPFEDREISGLIYDALDLIHDFDWYKSGDTDEETYLKAKQAFKEKWLNNPRQRTRRIVDETLAEFKFELYKTYGFEDESPPNKTAV